MGDRICLTFTDGRNKSPTLYAHWDGFNLIENAHVFFMKYHDEIRSEPSNWMFNFINFIGQGKVRDGLYYLYPSEDEASSPDNNGFWMFNTETGVYWRV